jgi:glycosyltransferase involved in cell wall biosynthesis
MSNYPFRAEPRQMTTAQRPVRVLYSFPYKLGAGRICTTAWHQVDGLAAAGADVLVFPGVLHKPLPATVKVHPTLARGKLFIPYRLLGNLRACALHDFIVAREIEKIAGHIDIIHTWPTGALLTLKAAARLGIPTVLERPNAHTRFAYEVVQTECDRLGVALPRNHDHAYKPGVLHKEEEEYQLAHRLLCPSEFVVRTFLDQGLPMEKLVRHIYGFDEKAYYPESKPRDPQRGLTMVFVGECAVRKGLHYALEAWLQSPAHRGGTFLIAGEFLPAYAKRLSVLLAHPSVKVLGRRNDVPELMRKCDIMILPSIEEGFGLVCTEAMASGCVPLASEACTDICRHMENALVHRVGDVETISRQITLVHENRALLERLRTAGLRRAPEVTWSVAGKRLLRVYEEIIEGYVRTNPTKPVRH